MTKLTEEESKWFGALIEEVAKDAIKVAITRCSLEWDKDTEWTEDSIAQDSAWAIFGEGTCSDVPLPSVRKLLREIGRRGA